MQFRPRIVSVNIRGSELHCAHHVAELCLCILRHRKLTEAIRAARKE